MSRIGLQETKAHKKLEDLKKNAFDLTKEGVLNQERIHKYKATSGELDYLFSMQQIPSPGFSFVIFFFSYIFIYIHYF